MKKLTITMVHILPNRVRLKLSAPIKDTKTFYSNIKNNLKYLEMKYNTRLKTVTLNFSPSEIFLQEIIYRVAISFSIENGLLPVKLIEENPYKSISPLSMYALASIVDVYKRQMLLQRLIPLTISRYLNKFQLGYL